MRQGGSGRREACSPPDLAGGSGDPPLDTSTPRHDFVILDFGSAKRVPMPRTGRPVTVTFGELQERVEESLADPRPNMPAREVFERLREHHRKRTEAVEE
jgi:hypothetical protein